MQYQQTSEDNVLMYDHYSNILRGKLYICVRYDMLNQW